MFFRSTNKKIEELFDVQISLIDSLISRCSVKQSEVLKLKLLGYSEKEISKLLQRSQSTISQHSNAAGWNSLEKALNYYENQIK